MQLVCRVADEFQFTPLREGRRARKARRHATARFQFTPLREGRPHSPSRCRPPRRISIHAPPRGATSACTSRVVFPHLFQFTPLREGRRWLALLAAGGSAISIHAPPRGATRLHVESGISSPISIHAPPRGATKAYSPPFLHRIYFNSRPSARGDLYEQRSGRGRPISIHAPPRGATGEVIEARQLRISIHAPPRGATSSSRHVLS